MSAPVSHPFTCNTCQVAFRSSDLQRTHMQSDWHRYNLKRRVASLPPLSSEIFAEKVLANKASAAATAARASYERACEACGKNYYSENAYVNHLSSHRHRAMISRQQKVGRLVDESDAGSVMSSTFLPGGTDTEASERASVASTIGEDAESEFEEVVSGIKNANIDEDDDPVSRRPSRPHHPSNENRPSPPLSPEDSRDGDDVKPPSGEITKEEAISQCLFCTHTAEGLQENLTHMQKIHGMFVPERQYLVDLEGLVLYLSRKVHIEYQCLFCNRLKWSEDGIKTHMRDLSHCKIAYDTEEQQLEIGDFYDFRSTYSDGMDTDEDEDDDEVPAEGGGVKLGAKRSTKMEVDGEEDSDEDEEGDGWETDSTVSSIPSEELGALYNDLSKEEIQARLRRAREAKKHKSSDGFHSHAHAAYHDDYELHLPTGRVAGHRSLNKYYRQNLRTYPTPAEREEQQRMITEEGEDRGSSDESTPRTGERGRGRDQNRQLVSRANGGLGLAGVTDGVKRQLAVVEKKERKRAQRQEAKQQWRTDVKGNSQKHFRDPLLQ